MRIAKPAAAALTLLALAAGLTACSSGADQRAAGGEIVITCATCQESPTDPFLQYNYEAAQRFNTAFKGKYRIDTIENANAGSSKDRLQYYQRLALADDLPDLFQLNAAEIKTLAKTGKLHDFGSELTADKAWAQSFQEHGFDAFTGPSGQRWAIPQQRDPIGIYYNKAILSSVGYNRFPGTWDDFERMAAKVKANGRTPLALDGDWATMLMWSNLIGTHEGGVDFLTKVIGEGGNWADNAAAVAAAERLKGWHTAGYINDDAFAGEFSNAAAAYNSGNAAAIPNGPWFVSTNLKTAAAKKSLYENTGYAPAPGWGAGQGLIMVSGAGWVSAARDQAKLEAVTAFMKFVTSPSEVLTQAKKTGANPATKVSSADVDKADLEPLSRGLAATSTKVPLIYPHVRVHGPAGFSDAWKNLWPSYVRGEMDTAAFLSRLSQDANAGER
jgi:raffinose/stachyose/melibiose transport system substrate-binding protein